MAAHIERVVTSGPAGPDGGASKESNIWVVGDDDQVMVIDAAHDVGRITAAVGGRHVSAIACTHGHTNHVPGSVSLYVPALDAVFSGDTLAARGPGSTAADDFPIIITSIHDKLFGLPPRTTVYPGHGEPTTIKDQAPYLEEWVGTTPGS